MVNKDNIPPVPEPRLIKENYKNSIDTGTMNKVDAIKFLFNHFDVRSEWKSCDLLKLIGDIVDSKNNTFTSKYLIKLIVDNIVKRFVITGDSQKDVNS